MGSNPDYKSGAIAMAKNAIESHKRDIERLREEAKLKGNAHRKDYINLINYGT